MEPQTQQKKSHGALIGSLIIVVIILIGGIYIWQARTQDAKEEKARQEQAIIDSENIQTGNELDSLEQEINNTDTNTGVDTNQIQ